MLPKKEEIRDKVVLVGLNSPVLREDSATEESMDELSALVETADGETAGIVLQNRPAPDPRTFIGEGKVAEAARPFSRRNSTALSMSPSEAVKAFLQSIMPTPVISRRFLTSAAVKAIIFFLQFI